MKPGEPEILEEVKQVDAQLSVGDIITPDFCARSTVIGIDHYVMQSFDGQQVRWDSHTLTSDSPAPFNRWWLVNTPGHGPQVVTAAPDVPGGAEFRKELSGLVTLNSEGNADLSAEVGALAMYADESGLLYAEEVFDGAERMVYVNKPYHG
jgi:hypothetical protein